jgi:hypothetical protein
MPKVKIAGVHPDFNGEYELAMSKDAPLKSRELRTIKQIGGVRPLEITEALAVADIEVVIALAVIALQRAGRGTNLSPVQLADVLFADSDAGAIRIDFDDDADEEDEDRPPGSSPTPSGVERKPDEPGSESESREPGGPSSPDDGESQEQPLRAIGEAG